MKRKLPALLLAALLLVSLSMTALAEDTPTYGAYNAKAESGYTLTPDGTADGGFYANASAFTLSCPAGTSGEQTLVLLLVGDSRVPTAENLQYIDQQASDGSISFTLKPKELTAGTSYSVYLSTTSKAVTKVASFQYGEKPAYTLGDVNGDGRINADDAVLVLRYAVELTEFNETQKLAADVSKDGRINADDAVLILRFAVNLITEF
jgi:hypothetical protein